MQRLRVYPCIDAPQQVGLRRLDRDKAANTCNDAARKTRLTAGSITFGYNSRDALERHRPDYLSDSYEQLVRAVLG